MSDLAALLLGLRLKPCWIYIENRPKHLGHEFPHLKDSSYGLNATLQHVKNISFNYLKLIIMEVFSSEWNIHIVMSYVSQIYITEEHNTSIYHLL